MSHMRKLLESMTKFAGEPAQKPGDQVRGTEPAKKKKSGEHPFQDRLVGGESVFRELEQQLVEGALERRLREEFEQFNEEFELAGVGVAYDLGRRAYKERKTITDNPYSATREARKYNEWEKGLERGKHDANDARLFRNSIREQGVAEDDTHQIKGNELIEYLMKRFDMTREQATELLKKKGLAEGSESQLDINQLAAISDAALDAAYGYGRSSPGNTFGWQANLKSAAYAKHMIDKGVTDIEAISDAIHKGWNVTAHAFVKNPDQFDDTEKLRAAGKLEAKLQQRAKLMNIEYAQLSDEEQEKDRVVARAMLQAITGEQGVAEEQVTEYGANNPAQPAAPGAPAALPQAGATPNANTPINPADAMALKNTLSKLKTSVPGLDVTKASTALAKADANTPLSPGDQKVTSTMAPELANVMKNPQMAGQLKMMIDKAGKAEQQGTTP